MQTSRWGCAKAGDADGRCPLPAHRCLHGAVRKEPPGPLPAPNGQSSETAAQNPAHDTGSTGSPCHGAQHPQERKIRSVHPAQAGTAQRACPAQRAVRRNRGSRGLPVTAPHRWNQHRNPRFFKTRTLHWRWEPFSVKLHHHVTPAGSWLDHAQLASRPDQRFGWLPSTGVRTARAAGKGPGKPQGATCGGSFQRHRGRPRRPSTRGHWKEAARVVRRTLLGWPEPPPRQTDRQTDNERATLCEGFPMPRPLAARPTKSRGSCPGGTAVAVPVRGKLSFSPPEELLHPTHAHQRSSKTRGERSRLLVVSWKYQQAARR